MADRFRPTLRQASLLFVSLAVGCLLTMPAEAPARTKVFKPVHSGGQVLVFRLRGVAPSDVRTAVVAMYRGGQKVERRLNVHRVRRALRNGDRILIRKPHDVQRALLLIDVPASRTCALGTFSGHNQPGSCWRPYSDQSPFNREIPPSTPRISNSGAIAKRLASFGPPHKMAGGIADTKDDWNHPIYFSRPDDPVYKVHCTETWGTCEVEGMQVRIPAPARPAGGGDAQLAVIDQRSGWEYDFWQVREKPSGGGTLAVSWGGRTRIDGDGLGAGATGASFGLAAGVIRPSELAAGNIDHALSMVVRCSSGTSLWPADRRATGTPCSARGESNANAPAIGQHFYLDMSNAEIKQLPDPAWQKTILRAMARYGMFVEDTGGTSWGVQFESGSSFTSFGYQDPWSKLGRKLKLPVWNGAAGGGGGRYIYDFGNAVNWAANLRVAVPCATQGGCG